MEKGPEILRRGTIKSQDALRGWKAEEGPGWPVEPAAPSWLAREGPRMLVPSSCPDFKWQARVDCSAAVGGRNIDEF